MDKAAHGGVQQKGKAMGLTNCPACKKQVSDQAAACPGCGHPMASRTQTIEQTGLGWKLADAGGGIGVILGLLVAIGGHGVLGVWMMVLGLLVWLAGRVGGWLYHG